MNQDSNSLNMEMHHRTSATTPTSNRSSYLGTAAPSEPSEHVNNIYRRSILPSAIMRGSSPATGGQGAITVRKGKQFAAKRIDSNGSSGFLQQTSRGGASSTTHAQMSLKQNGGEVAQNASKQYNNNPITLSPSTFENTTKSSQSPQKESMGDLGSLASSNSGSSEGTQKSVNNNSFKLAAPKPIRARPVAPPSTSTHQYSTNSLNIPPTLSNATKWFQASLRRDSSIQSQSEFQLSDGSIAVRKINFQNEQNLSFIIQEDESKNRSNSPLNCLQDLLEAEQEMNEIFNKPTKRDNFRMNPFKKQSDFDDEVGSPDARTAADDESFSNFSCSAASSLRQMQQKTFAHGQVGFVLNRPISNGPQPKTTARFNGNFAPQRVSCNPFKKTTANCSQSNGLLGEKLDPNPIIINNDPQAELAVKRSSSIEFREIPPRCNNNTGRLCNLQYDLSHYQLPTTQPNDLEFYNPFDNYLLQTQAVSNLNHRFMFALNNSSLTTSPAAGLLINSAQLQIQDLQVAVAKYPIAGAPIEYNNYSQYDKFSGKDFESHVDAQSNMFHYNEAMTYSGGLTQQRQHFGYTLENSSQDHDNRSCFSLYPTQYLQAPTLPPHFYPGSIEGSSESDFERANFHNYSLDDYEHAQQDPFYAQTSGLPYFEAFPQFENDSNCHAADIRRSFNPRMLNPFGGEQRSQQSALIYLEDQQQRDDELIQITDQFRDLMSSQKQEHVLPSQN
ncbi:hypothetical protein FGO68_gene14592 [Halteria grandinella]|uniref:Uncharacterized protein n=1 Tax=Halteria grandinella TaxID=5974 RepID=A0A8J8P7V2_HALGN|nr:hypothetical protein FGO68_gene14592 [Halteria grandinella]